MASITATVSGRQQALGDLSGLLAKDAIALLRERELRPAVEPAETDTPAHHGTVIGQLPPAGEQVRRGQLVTLFVGRHPGAPTAEPEALDEAPTPGLAEPAAKRKPVVASSAKRGRGRQLGEEPAGGALPPIQTEPPRASAPASKRPARPKRPRRPPVPKPPAPEPGSIDASPPLEESPSDEPRPVVSDRLSADELASSDQAPAIEQATAVIQRPLHDPPRSHTRLRAALGEGAVKRPNATPKRLAMIALTAPLAALVLLALGDHHQHPAHSKTTVALKQPRLETAIPSLKTVRAPRARRSPRPRPAQPLSVAPALTTPAATAEPTLPATAPVRASRAQPVAALAPSPTGPLAGPPPK